MTTADPWKRHDLRQSASPKRSAPFSLASLLLVTRRYQLYTSIRWLVLILHHA
jgi:hypothetical protein